MPLQLLNFKNFFAGHSFLYEYDQQNFKRHCGVSIMYYNNNENILIKGKIIDSVLISQYIHLHIEEADYPK